MQPQAHPPHQYDRDEAAEYGLAQNQRDNKENYRQNDITGLPAHICVDRYDDGLARAPNSLVEFPQPFRTVDAQGGSHKPGPQPIKEFRKALTLLATVFSGGKTFGDGLQPGTAHQPDCQNGAD